MDEDINDEAADVETTAPEPDEKSPSDHFMEKFKYILHNYTEEKWPLFEDTIEKFTKDIQATYKIKIKSTNKQAPPQNPHDPTYIQRLYRRNRRSAIRKVLDNNSEQCNIPHEILKQKFFTPTGKIPDTSIYNNNNRPKAPNPPSYAPFTIDEVKQKLKAAESTAPGADRITYNHRKSYDSEAKVLTIIYNICLKAHKIPDHWKTSSTIFIPKSGNPLEAANWRPISLTCTTYKIFASLIARR